MMELRPVIPFEPIRSQHWNSEGGNWIAQIKWDGVRMLSYYDGGQTRLFNRRMNERTMQYPELLDTSSYCRAQSVILDGEVIAFDQNKPSFHEVMKRESLRLSSRIGLTAQQVPVTYMVFDVLFCDGAWVTDLALAERQKLLESLIIPSRHVQLVSNYPDGKALMEVMKLHQMEGVVCKDLTSTYAIDGKDGRWVKHKFYSDLVAAIGGVTYRSGTVNSLLLGLYDGQGVFIYIGHAGAGKVTGQEWQALTELIKPLIVKERPFHNEPERSKDSVWLKPSLTVKVEYLEFTPGGTMRQPIIQAFVNVPAVDCKVEQILERA
ncbi:MAG: dependent ligase [Paenibacillus sp.]|nr:dependent ligase [Paenibacillus sp.]